MRGKIGLRRKKRGLKIASKALLWEAKWTPIVLLGRNNEDTHCTLGTMVGVHLLIMGAQFFGHMHVCCGGIGILKAEDGCPHSFHILDPNSLLSR